MSYFSTIYSDNSLPIRALHDLEKHGYIRRLPRYRESGSRSSNLYVLVDD